MYIFTIREERSKANLHVDGKIYQKPNLHLARGYYNRGV
jgi:hypothetical protein